MKPLETFEKNQSFNKPKYVTTLFSDHYTTTSTTRNIDGDSGGSRKAFDRVPLKNFRPVYFYILYIVLTSLMIWFPCTQSRSNKLKGGNKLLEIAKIKKFP